MPFLSKAVHYAFDAAIVSTVLAGVKRTTGYSPDPTQLPLASDATVSSLYGRYLSLGEYIFDHAAAYAHTSKYFKQSNPALGLAENFESIARRVAEQSKDGAGAGGKGGSWWGGAGK